MTELNAAEDLPEFAVDAGGTFTDCLMRSPTGAVRHFKTLSSGLVRGTSDSFAGGTRIIDPERSRDPAGFWDGADCRIVGQDGREFHRSVVVRFDHDSACLTLRDPCPPISGTITYLLEPGWPAPVLGIRYLLGVPGSEDCPPVRLRLGTTRGTNALLTRTGARTVLLVTQGMRDVPLIGDQTRPDLFARDIVRPVPLFDTVHEINERVLHDGQVLRAPDVSHEISRLAAVGITPDAVDSVAICLLHGWRYPQHELLLRDALNAAGFQNVSCSSEVTGQIRFVPRCDTTTLDAYLTPVLTEYVHRICELLPGSSIRLMTSVGGLVIPDHFRGRDCVLSGPAGGVTGVAKCAAAEGYAQAIGFDMGGTSTDVSRWAGGIEYQDESTRAGVRIRTPMTAVETVAAGGGSICGFDGTRLFVGPGSAGADPGPACYGAGGPLTVTDLNVFLGRVLPTHFPFPLDLNAVRVRLREVHCRMNEGRSADIAVSPVCSSEHSSPNEVSDEELSRLAEGLLNIAIDRMAHAIRRISVSRGFDPRDHVLVAFGGAGGQHMCGVAEELGIRTILSHPDAGILSAFGISVAPMRRVRQVTVQSAVDDTFPELLAATVLRTAEEELKLLREDAGKSKASAEAEVSVELRYQGTESGVYISPGTFTVAQLRDGVLQTAPFSGPEKLRTEFAAEHLRLFGYLREQHAIESAGVRVEVRIIRTESETAAIQTARNEQAADGDSEADESAVLCFRGERLVVPVLRRSRLAAGMRIAGPAVICESAGTVVVDPGWSLLVASSGTLIITRDSSCSDQPAETSVSRDAFATASLPETETPDPVMLELFSNQFSAIAEHMGETLRRTALSTNVRERLDFSCALFDGDGALIVNAPHVPVHLGAMSETVRHILRTHRDMVSGDVFVTNDPFAGGSHLPDVTVVTPVFTEQGGGAEVTAGSRSGRPDFFVANRAHHAEIGGIVPGSMPPMSRTLNEEGVLIRSCRLVQSGTFNESEMRTVLTSGSHPSRNPDDNIADLKAQVAANSVGADRLRKLAEATGADTVARYMRGICDTSAARVRQCLAQLPDGERHFTDQMDDGTQIAVTVTVAGDEATVSFEGTGEVHSGNLNANRAITTSAALYCFRCLLDQEVPLNSGVLEPVRIQIPQGILNPVTSDLPSTADPGELPAVVGGNVETSQRIVDVMLGAFGLAAASQGTMNNLTFGSRDFGYYETICGGAGATAARDGADAVHTHMTNTRMTDPEILETRYPVLLRQFAIRRGSGGAGANRGGHGVVREIEFLAPLCVSMLSQRRAGNPPYGLEGGGPGEAGRNLLRRCDAPDFSDQGASFSVMVRPGDVLRIETPGGGGWGTEKNSVAESAQMTIR